MGNSFRRFSPMGLVLGLIAFGLYTGAVPRESDPFSVYQRKLAHAAPDFSFKDVTDLLPIERREFPAHLFGATYASVSDYDRDGFEDLLVLYAEGVLFGTPRLLRNVNGRRFEDVTENAGLAPLDSMKCISSAVFFDWDNDGWDDLYVACMRREHAFFRNEGGVFRRVEIPALRAFLEESRAINPFDFDGDGFLDLYITNYFSFERNPDAGGKMTFASNKPVASLEGGRNYLLRNEGGRGFREVGKELGVADRGLTWASGVADFNDDGYPDLFVANDYGFDQFYLNEGGKGFRRVTEKSLGHIRSRFSMSAEVGDIDNDGTLDLYVSNASKPGLMRGFNSLWTGVGGSKGIPRFEDRARSLGVDKCGWSWGAKFADFDKDGALDLFVVNGRSGKEPTDYWYKLAFSLYVPQELRQFGAFNLPFRDTDTVAPGQRNCVFRNVGGEFIDVTDSVGVTDELNGRSLAVFDFDNDGAEDIVITNIGASPILYKGVRNNGNSWIGFQLEGTRSNRNAIGARIELVTSSGRKSLREVFPGNGYLAQSSRRVLFGVPAGESVSEIRIRWPSGKWQPVSRFRLNAYNFVKEAL